MKKTVIVFAVLITGFGVSNAIELNGMSVINVVKLGVSIPVAIPKAVAAAETGKAQISAPAFECGNSKDSGIMTLTPVAPGELPQQLLAHQPVYKVTTKASIGYAIKSEDDYWISYDEKASKNNVILSEWDGSLGVEVKIPMSKTVLLSNSPESKSFMANITIVYNDVNTRKITKDLSCVKK